MISRYKILFLTIFVFYSFYGYSAPAGGNVVHGDANINYGGSNTVINQNSDKAIINWDSFDINKGENVHFNQNSSSSVVLNRVTNGNPTSIFGNLSANGNVFVINKAGVLIGNGASVNTGSFLASTADINDSDFLKGIYNFTGAGGKVINNGSIKVRDGGYAVLMGRSVENNGLISARLGKIYLSSGEAFRVDMSGNNLIGIAIDKGTVDSYTLNSGLINAEGSTVIMSSNNASNMVKQAVNNTGIINASSINYQGGKVILGAVNGEVSNSGEINVSSEKNNGGTVEIKADRIINDGKIIADGINGGKIDLLSNDYLKLGSNSFISSSAWLYGNGGVINLIAKNRAESYKGSITQALSTYGKGGAIEFSGYGSLYAGGNFSTYSKYGLSGTLLLDPSDMFIGNYGDLESNIVGSDGYTYIDVNWLLDMLGQNNVELKTLQGGIGTGNITLDAGISFVYDGANKLSLNAEDGIRLLGTLDVTNLSLIAKNNIVGNDLIKSSGSFYAESLFGDIQLTKLNLTGTSSYYAKNGSIHLVGDNIGSILMAEAKDTVSINSTAGGISMGTAEGDAVPVIKANNVILQSAADINAVIDAKTVSANGGLVNITNNNEGQTEIKQYITKDTNSVYTQNKGIIELSNIDYATGAGLTVSSTGGMTVANNRWADFSQAGSTLKLNVSEAKFIETGEGILTLTDDNFLNLKGTNTKKFTFDNNGDIVLNLGAQNNLTFDVLSRTGTVTTAQKFIGSSLIAKAFGDINVETAVGSASLTSETGNITIKEDDSITVTKAEALNGGVDITTIGTGNVLIKDLAARDNINVTLADAASVSIIGSGLTDLNLNLSNNAATYSLSVINNKNINLTPTGSNSFKDLTLSSLGTILFNLEGVLSASNSISIKAANFNNYNPFEVNALNVHLDLGGSNNITVTADNLDISGDNLYVTLKKDVTIKDINGDKSAGKANNLHIEAQDYNINLADALSAVNFSTNAGSFVFNENYMGILSGTNISINAVNNISGVGRIYGKNVSLKGYTIGGSSLGLIVYADKAIFHSTANNLTASDNLINIITNNYYHALQNYQFITSGAGNVLMNYMPVNQSLYPLAQLSNERYLMPKEALNIAYVNGDDLMQGGRIKSINELIKLEIKDPERIKKIIINKGTTEIQ